MRIYLLSLLLVSILTVGELYAQNWVTFTDETSTRLILEPFSDDPNGNPYKDGMEKDIAVADLDLDGDMDAIIVRKKPFSSPGARQDSVLLNFNGKLCDQTSVMAPEFLTTLTDARDVAIADLNGDGFPDVLVCNTFEQQPTLYLNRGNGEPRSCYEPGGSIPLECEWLGLIDASATMLPFIEIPDGEIKFCAVAIGDVTEDGSPDIYFSNYKPGIFSNGTDDVLLVNNGFGVFTDQTAARMGENSSVAFGTSIEIRDVDNDGDNDIVKTSTLYSAGPFEPGIYIIYNDGTGNFDGPDIQRLPVNAPYMFTIADFNGDGMQDYYGVDDMQDRVALAVAVESGEVDLFAYDLTSKRTSGFGGNVKVGDIDGDGDLDIGVGSIDVDEQNCGTSNGFALLRNNGTGMIVEPLNRRDQNYNLQSHDFDFIDIDGDGKLDMIHALCEGFRVLIQD